MADTDDMAAVLKDVQADMYASRFEDALARLDAALAEAPDHVDALYMRAVCLRYLERFDAASAALAALRAAAPDFGRGLQEQGHLHRTLGDREGAISAYRAAVEANPALHGAWTALAEALNAAGEVGEAAQARAQADFLAALPRELMAASNHLHESRLLKAEALARAFLQKHPRHVEGMRILAEIGKRLGVLDDAEFLLESAVAFEPDNIAVRLDYLDALRRRQKHEAALKEAEGLIERDPDSPVFRSRYAVEKLAVGDYDAALDSFDQVLARLPEDAGTHAARGHALKTMGRTEEAVASYRRAFAARPGYGEAYYALANLKTYRFTGDEIAAMTDQAARPDLPANDRIHLGFALGKAFEDRGEHEAAFAHYAEANALKRARSGYDAEQMQTEFDAQKRVCTPDLFKAKAGLGHDAPDPIFIVGLPRAGSTLIEQILASHSQVDGTLELPDMLAIAHRLRGRARGAGESRYPAVLEELDAEQLAKLGEQYIGNTRVHRGSAPLFTDKMPNNFRHVGLIKLILPNAKIIDARREPMACCFSGFKQLFAEGQEFTYSLDDVGRYYRGYADLMDHWDAVLPGQVLRVRHEEVVADLEGQVRRMLDFLGLDFEPGCVEFHKTERGVRTASSEQVRQPINTRGLDAWRPFEPWLDPLKAALGPDLAPPPGRAR